MKRILNRKNIESILLLWIAAILFVQFGLISKQVSAQELQYDHDTPGLVKENGLSVAESRDDREIGVAGLSDSKGEVDSGTVSDSRRPTFGGLSRTHVIQVILITAAILWGYSLVMSGKHGTGWLILAAIVGVFSFFCRLIKSLFQEVTSDNEVGDWEDE